MCIPRASRFVPSKKLFSLYIFRAQSEYHHPVYPAWYIYLLQREVAGTNAGIVLRAQGPHKIFSAVVVGARRESFCVHEKQLENRVWHLQTRPLLLRKFRKKSAANVKMFSIPERSMSRRCRDGSSLEPTFLVATVTAGIAERVL